LHHSVLNDPSFLKVLTAVIIFVCSQELYPHSPGVIHVTLIFIKTFFS